MVLMLEHQMMKRLCLFSVVVLDKIAGGTLGTFDNSRIALESLSQFFRPLNSSQGPSCNNMVH
jgi:hypothetical protein